MMHGRDDGNEYLRVKECNRSKVGLLSGCMHSVGVGSPKMLDVQMACRVSYGVRRGPCSFKRLSTGSNAKHL